MLRKNKAEWWQKMCGRWRSPVLERIVKEGLSKKVAFDLRCDQ